MTHNGNNNKNDRQETAHLIVDDEEDGDYEEVPILDFTKDLEAPEEASTTKDERNKEDCGCIGAVVAGVAAIATALSQEEGNWFGHGWVGHTIAPLQVGTWWANKVQMNRMESDIIDLKKGVKDLKRGVKQNKELLIVLIKLQTKQPVAQMKIQRSQAAFCSTAFFARRLHICTIEQP